MLKVFDVPTAVKTILRRLPPDAQPVPVAMQESIRKIFGEPLTPNQAVSRILVDVRSEGDLALYRWTERLDGIIPSSLRVPVTEIEAAFQNLEPALLAAMQAAANRIQEFHRRQPITSWITNDLGGTLGQYFRPIQRVGVYAPGGTAPLPSSVLMSVIPAKVAGVKEIVVAAPPSRDTGNIASITLAACRIAGVDEVYCMGGAQAIAALAYGTASIPAVDKIVGPGNLFVTLAKRQVYGVVGIDGLAGPTETMVIADDTARPTWVAADLLAQAEHDALASAILLTPSRLLAEAVQVEVGRLLESLPRAEIVAASLSNKGGIVLTRDLTEAIDLANQYGAEHLCLAVSEPWRLAEKIINAGGVFLGENSFEVLGDYLAGPSHVMPTGGTARFASPLNVLDFLKVISIIALDDQTARQISPSAAVIARAEMLEAHARSADLRADS